jgi:hypothetical protein
MPAASGRTHPDDWPDGVLGACLRIEAECPGWLVWWHDGVYYAAPDIAADVGVLSDPTPYVLAVLIKQVEKGRP